MHALVIPVKGFAGSNMANMRLAGVLTASERRELGIAMLEDILEATSGMATFVVTDDPDARSVAKRCHLVDDPGLGLNPAIDAATECAMAAGAAATLVLPCDVPLVQISDLETILNIADPVAVVASQDRGTNALSRRPADCIPALFGPMSADAHIAAAARLGLAATVLELDSLALDIDGPKDWSALGSSGQRRRSVALARSLSRLAQSS
ncbi:MAG: 2-phospho-L-lactate guanylyltransferase [Actinomycetota bacterium]